MVFKPADVMFARPTVFFFTPTLANFDYIIAQGFLGNMLTSLLLGLASTLMVVLIGTPAAYAFARFEMKAKDDLFLFILATRMAPPVCLVIPFYLIYSNLGLLDTFFGLTLAYMTFNLSFYVWVLRSFCRDLPVELEEAAALEGWSKLQIFWKIMVPQIWGTIAVVWTTITILVLKVFDIVLTMTNGQWNSQVLANLMFDWMFRGGGDFGRGATIAIIIMIAVIPIMIWNIRQANRETGGH